MSQDKASLGSEITIGKNLKIKNRILKSAMSEQLGDDGQDPKPDLARLYSRWAAGGVGLLVTGNVMIDAK